LDPNHQVIHRDVKSLNILLTDNMRAKITDFGDAAMKAGVHARSARELHHTNRVHGTAAWMAPEMMDGGGNVTSAIDVFSFGIVMWECITHLEPTIYLCYHSKLPRQDSGIGKADTIVPRLKKDKRFSESENVPRDSFYWTKYHSAGTPKSGDRLADPQSLMVYEASSELRDGDMLGAATASQDDAGGANAARLNTLNSEFLSFEPTPRGGLSSINSGDSNASGVSSTTTSSSTDRVANYSSAHSTTAHSTIDISALESANAGAGAGNAMVSRVGSGEAATNDGRPMLSSSTTEPTLFGIRVTNVAVARKVGHMPTECCICILHQLLASSPCRSPLLPPRHASPPRSS
jgi:serine/threonine protein kinase